MSFINVNHISKTFKVAKRKSGLLASLKSFFKRDYTYIDAVKDVSFQIQKGEIVGYIGPNGAGKSTTIKMLSGILVPDSGTCKIGGLTPWKDREKYVKDIYDLDEKEYKKTRDSLIKMLDIEDIVTIPVRQLSLGQRMRCEIAASLLHKPSILFLDEHTAALDPKTAEKVLTITFYKTIRKMSILTAVKIFLSIGCI